MSLLCLLGLFCQVVMIYIFMWFNNAFLCIIQIPYPLFKYADSEVYQFYLCVCRLGIHILSLWLHIKLGPFTSKKMGFLASSHANFPWDVKAEVGYSSFCAIISNRFRKPVYKRLQNYHQHFNIMRIIWWGCIKVPGHFKVRNIELYVSPQFASECSKWE